MVGIGLVGIGFMGMIHYLAAEKLAKGKVVALCSRDKKKLAGDWTSIQGNFGPRGTQMDLSGKATYADFAELLKDPNVQLVDLCVPNDQHASLAIQALEAGKHVLVEKPIALTTADAEAMMAAAKASGKLLMVAHVLPFFPEFAFAREAVESGKYGKLKAAQFKRVISKPDWSAGISDSDRSGGPAIDLHIHDTHYIGLICGVPKAVHSRGVAENGAVTYLSTQYLYDEPNLAVSAVSGAITQSGRPFLHGFELELEGATITFESGSAVGPGTPLSVLLPGGSIEQPTPGAGDAVDFFAQELTVAVEAAATGIPAPALSGALAQQALNLCHAEVQSVLTGKVVPLS